MPCTVGYCWPSAVFPDVRVFGCLAYTPREGQTGYSYNDAVVYQDGRLFPACIVKAPFLRRIVFEGDDVSVELVSELGRTVIEGVTRPSTFRIGNPDIGGLDLQQGSPGTDKALRPDETTESRKPDHHRPNRMKENTS